MAFNFEDHPGRPRSRSDYRVSYRIERKSPSGEWIKVEDGHSWTVEATVLKQLSKLQHDFPNDELRIVAIHQWREWREAELVLDPPKPKDKLWAVTGLVRAPDPIAAERESGLAVLNIESHEAWLRRQNEAADS